MENSKEESSDCLHPGRFKKKKKKLHLQQPKNFTHNDKRPKHIEKLTSVRGKLPGV